jgi:hypothetical protein
LHCWPKKPAKVANKKVAEVNIPEAVKKEKTAPELKVSAKPASKAKKSKTKVVPQKLDEAS